MLVAAKKCGLPDTIIAPIHAQLWTARNACARVLPLWDHDGMNQTAERPRARSLSPLRALVPFLRPYRERRCSRRWARCWSPRRRCWRCLWRLRQLVDHGLAARDASTINRYFVGFLAAAVIYGVFAALRFYLVTWLGERVVADLRTAVYRRVVRMDPTFYE
jgi:ATP-binding cassette, subfamily B, bacterial